MAGKQGGPGNEPKPPEAVIDVALSESATVVMGMAFLMTTQLLMRFALWPDRIKDQSPGTRGRFEFLLQEILREIKNMPTQGMSESDEATGKRIALALLDQTVTVASGMSLIPTMNSRDFPLILRLVKRLAVLCSCLSAIRHFQQEHFDEEANSVFLRVSS
jgi:hypothetical protein